MDRSERQPFLFGLIYKVFHGITIEGHHTCKKRQGNLSLSCFILRVRLASPAGTQESWDKFQMHGSTSGKIPRRLDSFRLAQLDHPTDSYPWLFGVGVSFIIELPAHVPAIPMGTVPSSLTHVRTFLSCQSLLHRRNNITVLSTDLIANGLRHHSHR
jgi:hypothetical protein